MDSAGSGKHISNLDLPNLHQIKILINKYCNILDQEFLLKLITQIKSKQLNYGYMVINGFSYYHDYDYVEKMIKLFVSKIKFIYFMINTDVGLDLLLNGIYHSKHLQNTIIIDLSVLSSYKIVKYYMYHITKCIYKFFNKQIIYFKLQYIDSIYKELKIIQKMLKVKPFFNILYYNKYTIHYLF